MYLKAHRRRKDGKQHVYYSVAESVRVGRKRVFQRTVLHLGELNTTQLERWQRTIEVLTENGASRQMRLFSDREGRAPGDAPDVAEVVLGSLEIRRPRRFGACWVGCKLWEQLGLGEFWRERLAGERGAVAWEKVVELLAVNRLVAPRSELFVHEKWFPQTAMEILLDCGASVAAKDRLYRALDRMLEHKEALERHLAGRWRDLFGAKFQLLLYDLTSTYFEGGADQLPKARRGYSRDHRPDCKQLIIALVVTPEGFPLSYEVFAGDRADVTTLGDVIASLERKHGKAERIWVFDRGIVSEENLQSLRRGGARYLVGTPRSALRRHEERLLEGQWENIGPEVAVQLLPEAEETYVLARSRQRAHKEKAMRARQLRGLHRDLGRLASRLQEGRLKDAAKALMKLGQLSERWPVAWRLAQVQYDQQRGRLRWTWDKTGLRNCGLRDGAYLLRTNLTGTDPASLWKQYTQLTEVESVFRTLKSDMAVRPIWHFTPRRVEAHVMVAFLGYCLWVCLKHQLRAAAPALTPWQLLDQFDRILMVEVWFDLRSGGAICLERITRPEPAQIALLHALHWQLPKQPPPRIYKDRTGKCVADQGPSRDASASKST